MSREREFGYVLETPGGFVVSIDSEGVVMVSLAMEDAMRVTEFWQHHAAPLHARRMRYSKNWRRQ